MTRFGTAGLVFSLCVAAGSGFTGPATAQESPHGELSIPCENCHTSESWKQLRSPMTFDHASTGFSLTGQHAAVSCKTCHISLKFGGTPAQCGDCHSDVHRGELGGTCERCHTPRSWLVPDMPERHSQTRFPLVGAHRATACRDCHVSQERNEYRGVATDCYSCHRQQYEATMAPAHAQVGFGTDCAVCHAVDALLWGGVFDHALTGFVLTGAHAAVPCGSCHPGNRYKGTPTDCVQCHQTDYNGTTNPAHASAGIPTTCAMCHTTQAWQPASFDHSRTGFPLTGAHATVPCKQCHVSGYANTPTQCSSCHQQDFAATTNPPHVSQGLSTDCQMCHSTTAWNPSTFQHDGFFPISAGSSHPPGRWTTCADCHNVPGNFQAFACTNCHAHIQSLMDPQHASVPNYQFNSQACYQCHPRGGGGG